MDDNLVDGKRPTFTSQDEIEGRNMWMVWTGGNDRLWDRLTQDSLGSFDLLKTISSHRAARLRTSQPLAIISAWSTNRASPRRPGPIRTGSACGSTCAIRAARRIRSPNAERLSGRHDRRARQDRGGRFLLRRADRRSSACGSSRIPTSTRRRGGAGTPSGSTTTRSTTPIATSSGRIASACRAGSVTSGRTRSGRRPIPRTPRGRI